MNESGHTRVLAVDGGGTRCRVALRAGVDVTVVETGSANVSTDFDGGVQQIHDGLDALADKIGEPVDELAKLPTFVGLAGVTGAEIAGRLREALPFSLVRIEDDRPAALRGALGDRDGVIAHCGTGSFYGSHIAGAMRFSGGWGPVLGDEASAQWIGRLALGRVLEAVDGRVPMTGLAEAFLDKFDGAPGVVRFAGTARPHEFGALAPMVTSAAESGDALGVQVMRAGADEIARSLPIIGWVAGRVICLTGGIGPRFEPYLPEVMRADVAPSRGEPLSGALALAAELAGEAGR